jgi:hypothetical protein
MNAKKFSDNISPMCVCVCVCGGGCFPFENYRPRKRRH